jgi:hypothetical protein
MNIEINPTPTLITDPAYASDIYATLNDFEKARKITVRIDSSEQWVDELAIVAVDGDNIVKKLLKVNINLSPYVIPLDEKVRIPLPVYEYLIECRHNHESVKTPQLVASSALQQFNIVC